MKKNWKDAIRKYALESKNFNNASGGPLNIKDGFIGSNSFVGQANSGYANGQNMGGEVYSQIDDSDKFYTITITNTQTTGSAVTAIVFGANQYGISADQANAGVTVEVAESSHTQARASSLSQPFWVNGLRYSTSTTTQLNSQVMTIQYKSASGDLVQKIFRPLVYKTASQNQNLQIDAPGYKFPVDGNTQLQLPVISSEIVVIILQIGGKFDATKAIQGDSALAVAGQRELATGIVTVMK